MIGWIVLGVAVAGYLIFYRIAYRFFDDDDVFGGDEASDKVIAVLMAMLIALFWPLGLVGYGLWLFATPTTARERRVQVEAMEQRKRQLQEDIDRLERETKKEDPNR